MLYLLDLYVLKEAGTFLYVTLFTICCFMVHFGKHGGEHMFRNS
jgi:hypothetical protein